MKALPKAILSFLGTEWNSLPVARKLELAPLFLPVVSREEVDEAMYRITRGNELEAIIKNTSRYWQDAKLLTLSDDRLDCPEGEIFFEPFDGYRLTQIGDATPV